jgi:Holliday junction DNA helicase RuvB
MTDSRLINSSRLDDDAQYEAGLRPRTLADYIGQRRVKENLDVSIAATRQRNEALDTSCCTARLAWARPHWRT